MNFDSPILIDALNGVSAAADALRSTSIRHISVVARAEVLAGAFTAVEVRAAHELFAVCQTIDVDVEIADAAAAFRREHRIKLPDALIAATAATMGEPLVTRDERLLRLGDFVRVPYRLD